MKIIYRGGYNKRDSESVKSSIFYEYADTTKELIKKDNKVAFINFAKPDGYYNQRIREIYEDSVEIIDTVNQDVIDWLKYDLIYLTGGDQNVLKQKMVETGFSIDKLKKDVVIIGDSAGAYVMSAYFPSFDHETGVEADGDVIEGLYPKSDIYTLAHVNNFYYVKPEEIEWTREVCTKFNVRPLFLKENEAKLLDENGELADFNFAELFHN